MNPSHYRATAASIYLFFVVYGMAVIVMAQSSAHLQAQWGATEGEVLVAISGVGIGKVVGPAFAGFLSDRVGRRTVILLSLGLYATFLLGLLVSPTWQVGLALAVTFGLANAIGDTGNYPTLMEAFPQAAGSASVVVKAAIALGQFLLPLVITAVAGAGLAWGSPLIGLALVLAVLFVVQLRLPFPDHRAVAEAQRARLQEVVATRGTGGARVRVEGVAMVLYGFFATAMFWLAQNCLPRVGMTLAGMDDTAGRGLISFYSAGSFLGVLVTATLVARAVPAVAVLVVNPVVAGLAYLAMLLSGDPTLYAGCAFAIGFFAAGGLFQLAVVVLAEFFPDHKGVVTSMIGLASGASAFVMPFVAGRVVGGGLDLTASYRTVVLLGVVVAAASAVLGALVAVRHRTLLGEQGRPVRQAVDAAGR
ncbi:MFS transporter [Cellulomonas citrea]|uniref:MFS transporter n=1 Tax=Cellulomonas citrea TaxID=1909423 RepID=UPI00135926C3|nr:MFS transporter [Cellulomonas citrea]